MNDNNIPVRGWLCGSRSQGLCCWPTSRNCGQQVYLSVALSELLRIWLQQDPVGGESNLSQRGFKGLFPFPCDPLLSTRWHSLSWSFIRKCPSESLQLMQLGTLETRFLKSSTCSTLLRESFGRKMLFHQFFSPLKCVELGPEVLCKWTFVEIVVFYLLTSLGFWIGSDC